jgi:hypothetical protein
MLISFYLSGKTFGEMQQMIKHLQDFNKYHPIRNEHLPAKLKASVIAWHSDYKKLVVSVVANFFVFICLVCVFV